MTRAPQLRVCPHPERPDFTMLVLRHGPMRVIQFIHHEVFHRQLMDPLEIFALTVRDLERKAGVTIV